MRALILSGLLLFPVAAFASMDEGIIHDLSPTAQPDLATTTSAGGDDGCSAAPGRPSQNFAGVLLAGGLLVAGLLTRRRLA